MLQRLVARPDISVRVTVGISCGYCAIVDPAVIIVYRSSAACLAFVAVFRFLIRTGTLTTAGVGNNPST